MPSAAHRQTKYVAAPPLGGPTPLPLPAPTPDIDQARADLTEYGLCFLTGVLSGAEVDALREQLERQAAAERSLGALAPPGTEGPRQQLSNLVNKGKAFLDAAYERYAERHKGDFGDAIPGVFFDEPYISAEPMPWTDDLPERFRQRTG